LVYIVTLSPDERASLSALIQKGRAPVRQLLKARILLKADASGADAAWSDGQIAAALETSTDTISRTRQRPVHPKPNGGFPPIVLKKSDADDRTKE
jgi:hypothetical protein